MTTRFSEAIETDLLHRYRDKYGETRIVCPACSHDRKTVNQKEETLSLAVGDEGILYHCWHCDGSGRISTQVRATANGFHPATRPSLPPLSSLGAKPSATVLRLVTSDEPKPMIVLRDTLDETGITWLKSRGISAASAIRAGCVSANPYFRKLGRNGPAVAFPFRDENGKIEATKFRSTEQKDFSAQGSAKSMFNGHNLTVGEDVFIVEGEVDVLSMIESAFVNTASIPHGAANGKSENSMTWLSAHDEVLDKAPRVYLAGDMDEDGLACTQELGRRIGKEKCWLVKWPDGCKDANDMLVAYGVEGVAAAVAAATPFPLEGVYGVGHYRGTIDTILTEGLKPGQSTGLKNLDAIFTVEPGHLVIVTGNPGNGKSELIDQLMVNLASSADWSFAIFSPENPPALHIVKLAQKRAGLLADGSELETMAAAVDFVDGHFLFLDDDDGDLSSLESILTRIRQAVRRYGIRGAVIDPYNYIKRPSDMSETEWVGTMLTRVRKFARAHGVVIFFVAHPKKQECDKNGVYPVPTGYSISGSASWFSKADVGLTVHKNAEDPFTVEAHVWKSRFSWVATEGVAYLQWNPATTVYADGHGPSGEVAAKPSVALPTGITRTLPKLNGLGV